MSKQSEALAKYFSSHGIKNKDIAEKLGISASAVCNMLAGRDSIGRARSIQLSDAYGFSLRFLVNGSGELFEEGPSIDNSYEIVIASKDKQIEALKKENERLWQLVLNLSKKD